MNRRQFLKTLAAVPLAPLVMQQAPGLRFHPDAFSMVMQPPAPYAFPARYDVLYGFGTVRPDFAVRLLEDEDTMLPEGRLTFAEWAALYP